MSDEALAHVAHTTGRLRATAATFAAHCVQQGFSVVSSSTHYLLIETGNATLVRQQFLHDYGILVRDCTSFGLPHHIRIAARTSSENVLLTQALEHFSQSKASATKTNPSLV